MWCKALSWWGWECWWGWCKKPPGELALGGCEEEWLIGVKGVIELPPLLLFPHPDEPPPGWWLLLLLLLWLEEEEDVSGGGEFTGVVGLELWLVALWSVGYI